MAWRPIHEAPKDGTRILLHSGKDWSNACYVGYFGKKPYGRSGGIGTGNTPDGWLSEPGDYTKYPRYWMPLPNAPVPIA